MTRLDMAVWLLVAFVAGLAIPEIAKHLRESPAHANTRAAFRQLHESRQIDSLREANQFLALHPTRNPNSRTRLGEEHE